MTVAEEEAASEVAAERRREEAARRRDAWRAEAEAAEKAEKAEKARERARREVAPRAKKLSAAFGSFERHEKKSPTHFPPHPPRSVVAAALRQRGTPGRSRVRPR